MLFFFPPFFSNCEGTTAPARSIETEALGRGDEKPFPFHLSLNQRRLRSLAGGLFLAFF